jgi:HAD superfamily hydrolase (TIGR01509 family)
MTMNIKGAIFDMDGTLVDSLMVWDVLWSRFGEKFLNDPTFHPDTDADKAVRTMTLRDAMNFIHERYNIAESGAALLDTANEMMREFYFNDVKLKPGVREFLDYLTEKGVKMCIASATSTDLLDIAIDHCDLRKYFPKIFSCGAIGKGKDVPDIYLLALDYLGTDKAETWVFEDSYVALCTASGIGLPTVGIYDKYNFDTDKLEAKSTIYIPDGGKLSSLID